MSKKEQIKMYETMLNSFLSTNANNTRFIPMQKKNKSGTDATDYLLEAENSGILSMEEKNSQEMKNIQQSVYGLYKEQFYILNEIERLKKAEHETKKCMKNFDKVLRQFSGTLEKSTKDICKLQKISSKCNNKVEKLSSDVRLIKRIIANISFLFGACSMSDSLDKIAHNWNKATKRQKKQCKGLKSYMIDTSREEME